MIIANGKRNRRGVLFVCMTALLLSAAVAVVVALRNRQQPGAAGGRIGGDFDGDDRGKGR